MAVAACGLHNYTLFRDRDLVVGYVEAGDDLLAALAELEASDGFADWASRFTGVFRDRDAPGGLSGLQLCREIWHVE
jgi:L-rhamnose mutarotase